MMASLEQRKALFKHYVSHNDMDKAVTMLCRIAVACAKKGKFDLADAYRDLLYEVDSSALVAIMKVNECIENEKKHRGSFERRHLCADFARQLTTDEADGFARALQTVKVADDQIVLRQGKPNDRLYLVDHGLLKMVAESRDQELLIRHLEHGDIIGEDTFFSVNVCTATVVALSTVHLRYLNHHQLACLEREFPGIGASLRRICSARKPTYAYLLEKKIDRRASRRIHLQSKIAVQLLTAESRHPMQRTVYADLWDVSQGGLCFHLFAKNKESVRRLIGRSLGVRITLAVDGGFTTIAVTGVVQGVQSHPPHHFSVHMKLNPPFCDAAMAAITHVATLRAA